MANTPRRRRRLIRGTGVLVLLATVLTVVGSVGPSSAQSIDPGDFDIPPEEVPKDIEVVEAEALLDCSNLTADAKAFADENKHCENTRKLTTDEVAKLPPDATVEGGVAPQDVRWGNCGASHIFVWRRGGGNAGVGWGFLSILGTVVRRNLTVHWWNGSRGTSGSYVDSNWMFSNVYSKSRSFYTRSGEVVVWLTGNVRLAWGGTCVILVPVDYEIIT